MKKIALTLLVLLSLFLAGTIVVLSTTKYYLNIPQYAYLTEDEVAWRQSDAIKPLLYEPEESLVLRRQEWDEITDVRPDGGPDGGVMGADMLPEVWEELEEVTAEIGDEVGTAQSGDETEVVWDVDGPGTGGYWMRKDWEGTVRGTDSWERLFNVTTRYVSFVDVESFNSCGGDQTWGDNPPSDPPDVEGQPATRSMAQVLEGMPRGYARLVRPPCLPRYGSAVLISIASTCSGPTTWLDISWRRFTPRSSRRSTRTSIPYNGRMQFGISCSTNLAESTWIWILGVGGGSTHYSRGIGTSSSQSPSR